MDALHPGYLIGLLIFLLLCSAFFSSAETGLLSLNRYRLRHRAREGHRGAQRANALLNRPLKKARAQPALAKCSHPLHAAPTQADAWTRPQARRAVQLH
ncbi:CNNM domain-containing protein, partial [Azotobacter chroococcum]|uniref:CNNM domain-containing protein n=1 Tax=Azotobacter chroococcum TaxID=353 RepID=UPI0010AE54C5